MKLKIQIPKISTGPFVFGSDTAVSNGEPIPGNWQDWLRVLFPQYFYAPFADRHIELWEWETSLVRGTKPKAFIAIWGRGGAKSTNAEASVVYDGAYDLRRYIWYICETQDQADEHVSNIGAMLESDEVERYYPLLAQRKVGKYGSSKGWRRNRLRTASGLTVDALGLDTARRGFKIEKQRPDKMIFDDIDSDLDTPETVEKKEKIITRKLLPAGSNDCAILGVQNLVHANGIFSRLHDGRAKYLANRIISGPYPAVIDLKTESLNGHDIITGGVATWRGQNLAVCQMQIDEWGLLSFRQEAQHEVYGLDGKVFLPVWWQNGRNRFSHTNYRLFNTCIGRWQFWDTALKDKAKNDPSMCMTVDLTKSYTILIRDIWTDRLESAYLPEKMKELAVKWNKDDKLQEIVIEDKGSGTTSIQTLRKSAPEWLAEKIREFTPHGTKEYRAKTASMWCPRDCVLFPYPSAEIEWYEEFLNDLTGQLFRFPQVEHDEFIDNLVMAIMYLEHFISQGFYARLGEQIADTRPADFAAGKGKQHDRVRQALIEAGYYE